MKHTEDGERMKHTKELVAFRMDAEMLARLDELTVLLSTAWRTASRSDVLRGIVYATLEAVEHDPERIREILGVGGAMEPNNEVITAWMEARKKPSE